MLDQVDTGQHLRSIDGNGPEDMTHPVGLSINGRQSGGILEGTGVSCAQQIQATCVGKQITGEANVSTPL